MFYAFRKKNRHESGQGLLEVIIAIGITIAGIVATLALILSTLFVSNVSQVEIIATNLAREGIEVTRSIRDGNWLKVDSAIPNATWNMNLADAGGLDYTAIPTFDATTGIWSLDFTPDTLNDDATVLWVDSNGQYNQFPGAGTGSYRQLGQYHRLLTLLPICWDAAHNEKIALEGETCDRYDGPVTLGGDPDPNYSQVGIEVTSKIQWSDHGKTHDVTLVEKMYNWKT